MGRSLPVPILILLLLTPAAAVADVLVTSDGQRIETKGAWEVRGSRVVFTTAQGQLSAVRLSEVDLEASTTATRESKQSPPALARAETPKEERAPVLVLDSSRLARQDARRTSGETEEAQQETMAAAIEGMADALAQSTGEPPGDETQQAMEAAMAEMGDAMSEALGEMGRSMADGMAEGMEVLGEFMAVAAEAAAQLQPLESKYDLETAAGMRAAAPEIAAVADSLRSRASEQQNPEVRQMILELARDLDDIAHLARDNPEAAIRRYQQNKSG